MSFARTILWTVATILISWALSLSTALGAPGHTSKEKSSRDSGGGSSRDSGGGRDSGGRSVSDAREADSAETSTAAIEGTVETAPREGDALPVGLCLTVQAGASFPSAGDASIAMAPTGVIAVSLPFALDSWNFEPRLHLQMSPLSFQPGANGTQPTTDTGLVTAAIVEARFGYAFQKIAFFVEGGGGFAVISGLESTGTVGAARAAISVELPLTHDLSAVVTPLAFTAMAASDRLKGIIGSMERVDFLLGASYLF